MRSHLQPILDVRRGVVAGYESLARFVLDPAPPARWFAEATAAGLDGLLEARALGAALDRRTELPVNTFLSVNVSPLAIRGPEVRSVFAGAGDLRGVVVELTEQTSVEDYAAVGAALEELRAAGAHIAIDDAGAGFASLRHVAALRPDFVKVDAHLVAGVDRDEAKAAVVEMLGVLASRLDAWLVAEGVETEPELEILAGLGVPLAQGYGLGRPTPAIEDLSADVRAMHRRLELRHRSGGLAALARSAPVRRRAGPGPAALGAVDRVDEVAVVIDEFDRPILLVTPAGPAEVLRASASDDLAAVAERAMTRPPERRYDPIACCDEQGRLLGLVTVDRLVRALATLARPRLKP